MVYGKFDFLFPYFMVNGFCFFELNCMSFPSDMFSFREHSPLWSINISNHQWCNPVSFLLWILYGSYDFSYLKLSLAKCAFLPSFPMIIFTFLKMLTTCIRNSFTDTNILQSSWKYLVLFLICLTLFYFIGLIRQIGVLYASEISNHYMAILKGMSPEML